MTTSRVGPKLLTGTVLALGLAALIAPGASAKTQTLHYFQVTATTQFFNASGHPIALNPPATLPVAGDSFDEVDTDFVGTAAHHAKRSTASDHLTCTFTGPSAATCDSQIAIGGSLLISNHFTLNFAGPADAPVPISEGAGAYRGVHGSFTSVDVPNSNNSNLTVHLS